MTIRMPFTRLAMVVLAAMVALPFVAADAMAAKEKFERTKPHVNVGTIGNSDQDGPGGLATPAGDGTTTPNDTGPADQDCKPDPSKPADAQAC